MTSPLDKKCLGMTCDWKHRCKLYHLPHAQIHFSPPHTGEHCGYFEPKYVREEDESND